ncbi:hypothetical protein P154DRAFT_528282 [Amniculicola lignicola CBS 123094]|uniref:Uncharacterized protein n=1 Tax=Amniculicola lignicola CBS 123094 TaxID=1392246 RepID=A0A6A5VVG3_9PLEO|nr:hypothetical protein P154DRAFT_528282 [Amniculicola lignicola CBS 123094]
MSSAQYIYIPNLVGRQMLRVPVIDEVDEVKQPIELPRRLSINTTSISAYTFISRDSSRCASPTISVQSVDEDE